MYETNLTRRLKIYKPELCIVIFIIILSIVCSTNFSHAVNRENINSISSCELIYFYNKDRPDFDMDKAIAYVAGRNGRLTYTTTGLQIRGIPDSTNIITPSDCELIISLVDSLFIQQCVNAVNAAYQHDIKVYDYGNQGFQVIINYSNGKIIETKILPLNTFQNLRFYDFSEQYARLVKTFLKYEDNSGVGVQQDWNTEYGQLVPIDNEYANPISESPVTDSYRHIWCNISLTDSCETNTNSLFKVDQSVDRHAMDNILVIQTVEQLIFINELRSNLETYSDSMRTQMMINSKMYLEESSSMEDYVTFILYLKKHATEELTKVIWNNIYEMFKAYPQKVDELEQYLNMLTVADSNAIKRYIVDMLGYVCLINNGGTEYPDEETEHRARMAAIKEEFPYIYQKEWMN